MQSLNLNPPVEQLIDLALTEDIGTGDVTTDHLVAPEAVGQATIVAKESLVLAGLDLARVVFERMDTGIEFKAHFRDGDTLQPGEIAVELSGGLAGLLTGERTALNFLQRLSGIATHTRHYMTALENCNVRLLDTRKTTPGWRPLEKYAVRVGGGTNHRAGLYDAVLIKDNHIAAAGGIAQAVERIKSGIPADMTIEVETSSIDEVEQALDAGAHIIMLDNMDLDQIREAVAHVAGRAKLEVSGGVTIDHLPALASTGVDYISSGALTHSAKAVDISMYITSQP